MTNKLNITATDQKVIKAVTNSGGKIFCVGGCIRDLLMGNKPKDIDYATDLHPQQVIDSVLAIGCSIIPDKTASNS